MKYAIVLAASPFADDTLAEVPLAEAAAREFSLALVAQGFSLANQTLLPGSAATRTTILSRVRKLAKILTAGDEVVVLAVTRGFHAGGESYLLCADSVADDLTATSLKLSEIYSLLARPEPRLTFYLDVGSIAEIPDDEAGIEPGLSDAELAELAAEDERLLILTAASAGEESHSITATGSRVWLRHICDAISGKVPESLPTVGPIFADKLQKYLTTEMPRTLRKALSKPTRQTPKLFTQAPGTWVVAELTPPTLGNGNATPPPTSGLSRLQSVCFRAETRDRIKNLAGYRKGQKLPDSINDYSTKQVQKMVSDDIKKDVEETYAAIREHLGCKRKDLEAVAESDGIGFIRTPIFDYTITVAIDPEDFSGVIWRREIRNIQDAQRLRSPEFQRLFGNIFDMLVFDFAKPVNVGELVDNLEDNPVAGTKIDVAADASDCTITIDGFKGSIHIQPKRMTISGRQSQSAGSLIDQFLDFQKRFADNPDMPGMI